jgi:hypothetical protein
VTIDKSGSNVAALEALNAKRRKPIVVRQIKYLNNIVEQDHRAIKRRTRPMLGYKDFRCTRILLSDIELMHMIKKGQMKDSRKGTTAAEQSYSLAASTVPSYRPIGFRSSRHPYCGRTVKDVVNPTWQSVGERLLRERQNEAAV